jgi:hypothetical protein
VRARRVLAASEEASDCDQPILLKQRSTKQLSVMLMTLLTNVSEGFMKEK